MHTIGVYSGRQQVVDDLRRSCPALAFAPDGDARDAARIALFDSDSHGDAEPPPRKSLVRVILCDGDARVERRQGELRVRRDAFLAEPAEYLSFANDLADTAIHASQLEAEISYLSQVHELMTMIDAAAV